MQLRKTALRGMIVLAVVIGLCLLFSGTLRTLTTPKVRIAQAKQGRFEAVTDLTGRVTFPSTEEMNLTVPESLSLTVTRVLATPGKQVKEGEKLLTCVVTDAEKTLQTLQQNWDAAREALDEWNRKNGDLRLSRQETLWKEAWERSREASRQEQEARLELLALTDGEKEPEDLAAEELDEETAEAYANWSRLRDAAAEARDALNALNRYAIAEDTWSLLQRKQEEEQKLQDAEQAMTELRLLARRAEVITAPHAGYVTAVYIEKGATLTGETLLLCLTPEDVEPVIRTDLSEVKESIPKGTPVTVRAESWGWVESQVTDLGLSEAARPYADVAFNENLRYALGDLSSLLETDLKLRLSSRSQASTCLIPSAAVRGSDDARYVYVGETESSAFAGSTIRVRKVTVTVLAESATTVSVAEDLSYNKILYMEDRPITEDGTVMLYEE